MRKIIISLTLITIIVLSVFILLSSYPPLLNNRCSGDIAERIENSPNTAAVTSIVVNCGATSKFSFSLMIDEPSKTYDYSEINHDDEFFISYYEEGAVNFNWCGANCLEVNILKPDLEVFKQETEIRVGDEIITVHYKYTS